jgi:hypothetical protein
VTPSSSSSRKPPSGNYVRQTRSYNYKNSESVTDANNVAVFQKTNTEEPRVPKSESQSESDEQSHHRENSKKNVHKNINLLELKLMAANRAMKSSNDLFQMSRRDGSFDAIQESKSEGVFYMWCIEDGGEVSNDAIRISTMSQGSDPIYADIEEKSEERKSDLRNVKKERSKRDENERQSFNSQKANLDMFKFRVQEEIKKNLNSVKGVVNEHKKKYEIITKEKKDFQNEDLTLGLPSSEKITKHKKNDDSYSSDEGAENISDDSLTQEVSISHNHKINQMNFDHKKVHGGKLFSVTKTFDPIDSPRREIIEFDVAAPDNSSSKVKIETRESDIAMGYQNSSESFIKNLECDAIYEEEEDQNSTIKFNERLNECRKEKFEEEKFDHFEDEKHIEFEEDTYLPQKRLEDTQRLKDYNDTLDRLPDEGYEWKDSQQNLFPPNLTGTWEIEELLQFEEQEEEEEEQNEERQLQRDIRQSNVIMEKILESENSKLFENNNTQSDNEPIIEEKSVDEDTIINLTSAENPLQPPLKPRNQSQYDEDEMLFRKRDSGEYIYHDTMEEPINNGLNLNYFDNGVFGRNKKSVPQYDTPEIKPHPSPKLKKTDSPIPKMSETMETVLIRHKTDRIEQLIDRMHMLIGKVWGWNWFDF